MVPFLLRSRRDSYVIQIKNRFDNDPRDSYNEFLNLLHDHQNSQKITMIVDKVCELFTDHQASSACLRVCPWQCTMSVVRPRQLRCTHLLTPLLLPAGAYLFRS